MWIIGSAVFRGEPVPAATLDESAEELEARIRAKLGDDLDAIRERGLGSLADARFIEVWRDLQLVWDLGGDILMNGGSYWNALMV